MYEDTAIETTERDGYTLTLHRDIDARNPFEDFEVATRLVFESRDYDFGDRHESIGDATNYDRYDFENGYITGERPVDSAALLTRYLRMRSDIVAAIGFNFQDYGRGMPSAYAHGPADVDLDGFAYVTRADFDKMVGSSSRYESDEQHAIEIMHAEIGEFSKYLEGDVYGFNVEGPDGEFLDGCWGFFGLEYAREEAERAFADAIREDKLSKWATVEIDPAPSLY